MTTFENYNIFKEITFTDLRMFPFLNLFFFKLIFMATINFLWSYTSNTTSERLVILEVLEVIEGG